METQINYIQMENCIYCKLDRRESFGNCFTSPQNISNNTITNIDFKNLKRIPKDIFNTSYNLNNNINYDNNLNNLNK